METYTPPWKTFLAEITKPQRVLQGVVEYGGAWFFTRPWGSFLLFSPILLVLIGAGSLAAYGIWMDPAELTKSYLEQAEEEIDSVDEREQAGEKVDVTAAIREDKVSERGELILRRVLQLEESNSRAKFLVGLRLAQSGRSGQARRMMRDLAPAGGAAAFAPAHAWLAIDQINRGVTDIQGRDQLLHDLEVAQNWDGTGAPLVAAYASYLEDLGRANEAETVLERAISSGKTGSEDLELKLAELAYKSGKRKTLNDTSAKVKERIRRRIEDGTASEEDYASLGTVFLLEKEILRARKTAEIGLQKYPESGRLKRIASESFRVEYLQQIKESNGESVNLALLDAALRIDPTNPAVSQEVARLLAFDRQTSEELLDQLTKQIANGQTTALTHILLSQREIRRAQYEVAASHLTVALQKAKGNPTILNNLGLCLALLPEPDFEQASLRIEQALSVAPTSAEYWDSLGEVRRLSGNLPGAVEAFEQAIGFDSARKDSRSKLAIVYDQMGLKDMAKIQRDEIERLSDAKREGKAP